jgi:toxin ParE1/3/4
MPARVLRRPQAARDAESIADHIAKDSLEAAIRFLENTELTLIGLADSPGAGTRFESAHSELANLRFRRINAFPRHIVFFIEHEDAIEVVRILHGARDLETELRTR